MIKVKVNNEYKDIVKIFCGGILQKEIIKVWSREAQEYVYESSVEYTGTLPIKITANGDALLDYRIYGADGGVGEPTENLFDENAKDPDNGFIDNSYLADNGNTYSYNIYQVSEYIVVSEQTTYYLFSFIDLGNAVSICFYDENKNFISGERILYKSSVVSPVGTQFLRISVQKTLSKNSTLTLSPSTSYIPYGYKLPMTVGDGNTVQTVPVYIGENRLEEDEYVSYSDGKIYRDVSGTLTPTDPPVPLPSIPTIDGTTIIDYDGTPKPSQMYIKYRR